MADYPTSLRNHLLNGFTRTMPAQWVEVYPAVGSPYIEQMNAQDRAFFDVQFRFNEADQETFLAWIQDDLQNGILPFNITVGNEYLSATQNCYFTADGMPQINAYNGNGIVTYSATLYTEYYNDVDEGLYDLFLIGAENTVENDPNIWWAAVDMMLNELLPEA